MSRIDGSLDNESFAYLPPIVSEFNAEKKKYFLFLTVDIIRIFYKTPFTLMFFSKKNASVVSLFLLVFFCTMAFRKIDDNIVL